MRHVNFHRLFSGTVCVWYSSDFATLKQRDSASTHTPANAPPRRWYALSNPRICPTRLSMVSPALGRARLQRCQIRLRGSRASKARLGNINALRRSLGLTDRIHSSSNANKSSMRSWKCPEANICWSSGCNHTRRCRKATRSAKRSSSRLSPKKANMCAPSTAHAFATSTTRSQMAERSTFFFRLSIVSNCHSARGLGRKRARDRSHCGVPARMQSDGTRSLSLDLEPSASDERLNRPYAHAKISNLFVGHLLN